MWAAEHTRHWSTRSADQEWVLKKLEPRETCLLCEEPLQLLAVYQCNHCSICGCCALKLRGLQHDLQCCQCKALSVFVMVVRHDLAYPHQVLMSPHGRSRAHIPATLHAVQRAGLLFVDSQEASKALNRLLIRCHLCQSELEGSTQYTTIEELQEHLVNRHGRSLCHLCVENIPMFPAQRKTYNAAQLRNHERLDDPTSNHHAHPACAFCERRFFDRAAYYSHCKREHVCCTLCPEPSEFNKEIFYKDFLALQRHCQLSHHVCTFCPIGASAFGTAKELSNHFRSKHGCDPPAVTSPNENITEKYLVVDATAREEPTVGDCRDLPRAQQATTRRPIVKAKAKKIVDQDDYDSPLFKQGRPSRRSKGKPANTQNCVKGKSEQNPKNRFHVLQSESDSN